MSILSYLANPFVAAQQAGANAALDKGFKDPNDNVTGLPWAQTPSGQRQKLMEGPEMKYNPLVVDAEGKWSLRPEFQTPGGADIVAQLMGRQAQEEAGLKNAAVQNIAQAQAQNRSMQAMRGGYRSPAQDRFNIRDLMNATQGVAEKGSLARSDIGLKGAELDRQAKLADIAGLSEAAKGTNQFNLDKYKTQAAMYGAGQTAQATRDAANSGK
jgi:hypothetical protein